MLRLVTLSNIASHPVERLRLAAKIALKAHSMHEKEIPTGILMIDKMFSTTILAHHSGPRMGIAGINATTRWLRAS
jgi:hypothetical protein